MQKYLYHKSIRIILTSFFFVVGIFSFVLTAEAGYVGSFCPYNFPTANFTLASLPASVFLKADRVTEFNNLYSPEKGTFYQNKVVSDVNNEFDSTKGGSLAETKQDTIGYDTAYDAACQDAGEWRAYEASCGWVTVDVYTIDVNDNKVKTGTEEQWQCAITKPVSVTTYGESGVVANNAYSDRGSAETAETNAKTNLETALSNYSTGLSTTVKESVKTWVKTIALEASEAATEEAEKTYNKCLANASGTAGAEAPISYDPTTKLSPGGLTMAKEQDLCDLELQEKNAEIAETTAPYTTAVGATETDAETARLAFEALIGTAESSKAGLIAMGYSDCIDAAYGDQTKKNTCASNKTFAMMDYDVCLSTAGTDQAKKSACSPGGAVTAAQVDEVAATLTPAGKLAEGEVLTTDQKAKVAALLANQEQSSPQEEALLSAVKDACGLSDLLACAAVLPYYYLYRPASILLIISGYMFDASLTLSIDKNFVNQPFITESWTVIRDFSNMMFIFILLYTGIQTILGMGDWRKTVLHIVIIALLINFSLFFTKVVIDAGNILAVGIFQAIGTPKDANASMLKQGGGIPERNLSESIVANFKPQKFLAKTGKVSGWNAAIVFIVAAIVNIAAAYVLFKVALLFIGRLLAFWFLMIISPFALISITLKGKMNIFEWWTSTLTSQAFVAPVFLFLLYLIMKVISAGGGIMSAFAK